MEEVGAMLFQIICHDQIRQVLWALLVCSSLTDWVRQCPPLAFSSPLHTKALSFVNMFFSLVQVTRGNTVRWYLGMEDNIEEMRYRRPAWFNSHPVHPGSGRCWPTCSMRGLRMNFWSVCVKLLVTWKAATAAREGLEHLLEVNVML